MPIRIPINLASEPFRRDRPALVGAAAAAAALLALLIFQAAAIVTARRQAAETRSRIDVLETRRRALDAAGRKLGTRDSLDVRERSLFLNTLIERKAISWTRIFADLERVMPSDVRLVSVRLPQVDLQNNVLLDMVVAAKQPEPVIAFLRKLEAAPQFGSTALLNTLPPSQTDQFFRYHVSVSYAQKL